MEISDFFYCQVMANYFIRFQKQENPTARLFCVPYAGATAAVYRPWIKLLPPEIELCAVEIPGRLYLKDKPAANMQALIDTIFPQILPLIDKPFAIFGHSFGSAIAYELAKRLQIEKRQLPAALFVSSRRAPHVPDLHRHASLLPDQEFLEEMQNTYQAIPEALLKEKELLKLLLPILKEDIRLNETYIGVLDPLLDVPVISYYGLQDTTLIPSEFQRWKEVTSKDFKIRAFEGGHFYIDTNKETIIADIARSLSM